MWKLLPLALFCVAPCSAASSTTSPTTMPAPAFGVEVGGVIDPRQWGLHLPTAADSVAVIFRLTGKEIEGMQGLPRVRLIEAADDLGNVLQLRGVHPTRDVASRVTVNISLSQPLRRATSIAVLKGEVMFPVGGQSRILSFDKLASRLEKPLEDPVLAQAGLRVTLTEQKSAVFPKAILLRAEGRRAGLTGARLSAASGAFGRPMTRTLDANGQVTLFAGKQIPDSMVLQMDVWWGGEEVTVPFEIKDIRLP